MSNTARSCCCAAGCTFGDCLYGAEIEDGCCHACDTLALWCYRPEFSIQQHLSFGGMIPGAPVCETCFTTYTGDPGGPVQAIYKFERTMYRCSFPNVTGPISLIEMPPACPPSCGGTPTFTDCCSDSIPDGSCQCNQFWPGIGGINTNRRAILGADDATKWFLNTTCHKLGFALGGTQAVGNLYDEFLCIVFFERWWKIAEDCDSNVRIYVPGCDQTPPTSDCGGIPFVESNLVPKWWIYACSGVPLYDFEIDDAVRFEVITADEADAMRLDITNKITPNQAVLAKMAEAGYLRAADWRAEQRQAYIDLHALYPSAGYGACIQDVDQMHTLGPYRKRCTEPLVGTAVQPLLRKNEVAGELTALQADCFKNYAGSSSDQAAYDFWCERQWVYFHGVPGGWQWAGWNAPSDGGCVGLGLTEIEAILRGCGRGDTSCIQGFKGEPRAPSICTPCSTINPAFTPCNNCNGDCESTCGSAPISACADDTLPVITKCSNFNLLPLCEGIRFIHSQYAIRHDFTGNTIIGFTDTTRMICLVSVNSFLVGIKRSVNSWSDSIPFSCRSEVPALTTFKNWPEVEGIHIGHSTICNPLSAGDFSTYTSDDLCCGGICYSEPCYYIDGLRNNCPPGVDCPPHTSAPQVACIGQAIPCTEP